MKVYINRATDPYENLASEEYLLEHEKEDVFLVWRNAPSVIIGKNQNAFAEVNLDFTRENQIAVVRRLTGGGAVFHDLGNVNFTFISQKAGQEIDFSRFAAPIVDALGELGVDAFLSGRNDLVVRTEDGEKKISGNAQCRFTAGDGSEKTMHHGTLLFDADLSRLQGALNVDPTKLQSKGIRSVRSRVANLRDLLGDENASMTVETFMDYLASFASERYGVPICEFDGETKAGIARLSENKYATDEWNLGRCGNFDFENVKRFPFGKIELSLTVREGKIADALIRGDFFGTADPVLITEGLRGIRYDRESVSKRLTELPVPECVSGAAAEDFVSVLFGE